MQNTFGVGSSGLHRAGNISLILSFSVFGLAEASKAEISEHLLVEVLYWETYTLNPC